MRKITWEKVSQLCRKLAQKIREYEERPAYIYAVPRRGLPIGVHLSHLTGIPLRIEVDDSSELKYTTVDDINDTGRTMRPFVNDNKCITVTLFERLDSEVKADIVGEYVGHNDWLVFPWENPENAFEDMVEYLEEGNRDAVYRERQTQATTTRD